MTSRLGTGRPLPSRAVDVTVTVWPATTVASLTFVLKPLPPEPQGGRDRPPGVGGRDLAANRRRRDDVERLSLGDVPTGPFRFWDPCGSVYRISCAGARRGRPRHVDHQALDRVAVARPWRSRRPPGSDTGSTPTHFTQILSEPTCGWAPVPCEIDQITSARSFAARFMTLPVMSLTFALRWCWSGANCLCSSG